VIARLTGQVTHSQSVLHDQDAVAIQAANDGTRRSRAKAAQGNARLVFNRGTERALDLLGQLLASQNVRGLKRFELASSLRTHRGDLAEMQLGVDPKVGCLFAGRHIHFCAQRQISVCPYDQVI
jgi:hypothetical protein